MNGNAWIQKKLTVVADSSFGGNLYVGQDASLNGNAWIQKKLTVVADSSLGGNLYVGLDASLNGNLLVSNNIRCEENLIVGLPPVVTTGGEVFLSNTLGVYNNVVSSNGTIIGYSTGSSTYNILTNSAVTKTVAVNTSGICAISDLGQYIIINSTGTVDFIISSNYGATFSSYNGSLFSTSPLHTAMSGNGLVAVIYNTGPNGYIYMSVGGGYITGSSANAKFPINTNLTLLNINNYVLSYSGLYQLVVSSTSPYIKKSSNTGSTFTNVVISGITSITTSTFARMSSTGQYQVIGVSNNGIYYSSNYGTNWSKSNYLQNVALNYCASDTTGQYLFAINGATVYYSTNYGIKWIILTSLTFTASGLAVSTSPFALYIASGTNNNLYKYPLTVSSTGDIYCNGNINGLYITQNSASLINNNIGLGYQALDLIDPIGSNNLAIGPYALTVCSMGQKNIGIGLNALVKNTNGVSNIAIGVNSLANLVDNSSNYGSNIGIGDQSLLNLTTGSNNTAVGVLSLQNNSAGSYNVAIGAYASRTSTVSGATSNQNCTYIGTNTHNSPDATSYSNSTALGYNATITASNQIVLGTSGETVIVPNTLTSTKNITVNTLPIGRDASNNLQIGTNALLNCKTGNNFAIGDGALQNIITKPSRNTAVGQSALTSLNESNSATLSSSGGTPCCGNTACGFFALSKANGSNNTAIGSAAGYYGNFNEGSTNVENCTFIGANTGTDSSLNSYTNSTA